MKLYRIKRKSDGKFFTAWDIREFGPNPQAKPHFGSTGTFFKGAETIKRHLMDFCCEWEPGPWKYSEVKADKKDVWKNGRYWNIKKITERNLELLSEYEVETLIIQKHTTTYQGADDFLGILESAE